jgi:hypothetical protein
MFLSVAAVAAFPLVSQQEHGPTNFGS